MRNPSDTNDELLIQKMRAGDLDAHEALFMKYKQRIFLEAYMRIQNETKAWQITLDVCLWLWNNKATILPDQSLKTVLIGEVHKRIPSHS
jgi:RNA polymerase sigma-70 factor (ECF subfamily)